MTPSQRRTVLERAAALDPPLPEGVSHEGTFHAEESMGDRGEVRRGGAALWLQFGERRDRAGVSYRLRLVPREGGETAAGGT